MKGQRAVQFCEKNARMEAAGVPAGGREFWALSHHARRTSPLFDVYEESSEDGEGDTNREDSQSETPPSRRMEDVLHSGSSYFCDELDELELPREGRAFSAPEAGYSMDQSFVVGVGCSRFIRGLEIDPDDASNGESDDPQHEGGASAPVPRGAEFPLQPPLQRFRVAYNTTDAFPTAKRAPEGSAGKRKRVVTAPRTHSVFQSLTRRMPDLVPRPHGGADRPSGPSSPDWSAGASHGDGSDAGRSKEDQQHFEAPTSPHFQYEKRQEHQRKLDHVWRVSTSSSSSQDTDETTCPSPMSSSGGGGSTGSTSSNTPKQNWAVESRHQQPHPARHRWWRRIHLSGAGQILPLAELDMSSPTHCLHGTSASSVVSSGTNGSDSGSEQQARTQRANSSCLPLPSSYSIMTLAEAHALQQAGKTRRGSSPVGGGGGRGRIRGGPAGFFSLLKHIPSHFHRHTHEHPRTALANRTTT